MAQEDLNRFVPDEGLVGCWLLDETEGPTAKDSSGSGNDGHLVGVAWKEIDGRRASYFDGTGSHIVIRHNDSLAIEWDITIAAWIWKETPNNSVRWDAIVSKTAGVNDYELLTSKARSDEPALFSPHCEPAEVYAGHEVPAKKWTHLAVTRREFEVTFFMDAHAVGTALMSGPFSRSGGDLQIGHDGVVASALRRAWRSIKRTPANGGMIGGIAGVAIYNRALPQEEIVVLHDETMG